MPQAGNYMQSIYIRLGTVSNLVMLLSIWEDMYRLYANTTPFYIRDLSIQEFWYSQQGLKLVPADTKGQLYLHKGGKSGPVNCHRSFPVRSYHLMSSLQ